jgi:hypothetical protein
MISDRDSEAAFTRFSRLPTAIILLLGIAHSSPAQTTKQLKTMTPKEPAVHIDNGRSTVAERPGTWSEWENLGEEVASAPSAVSGGEGHLAVFFRGNDAHLRSVWWGGGLWHLGRDIGAINVPDMKPSASEKIARALADRLENALEYPDWAEPRQEEAWTPAEARAIGDTLYHKGGNRIPVNSAPGCVMKAPRHIDCFVLDYAGRVWHRWYRGGDGWDRWQVLNRTGPRMTGFPTAVSWNDRRIDLFARGPEGQLMQQTWNGQKWQQWIDLGSIEIDSAPSCIAPAEGRFECFVRGPGSQLFHRSFADRKWSPWTDLGGSISSAPSATVGPNGRIDVFARGHENQLIHTTWDGRQWWPWEDLGGELDSAPSCVARRGVIDCFARGSHQLTGASDVLLHKWMVMSE